MSKQEKIPPTPTPNNDTPVGLQRIPTQSQAIEKFGEVEDAYKEYINSLPEKKRRRVINSTARLQTGVHAIAPLTCLGPERCPFSSKCPIKEEEEEEIKAEHYPIGKDCVLETYYIKQKSIEYLQHLDVNPNNPIEMSLVNELALEDLYKNRALMILSAGDTKGNGRDFMMVDIIGFNEETGQEAKTTKIHPAFEILERIEKRKEKILTQLMETRKSKADYIAKVGGKGAESRVLDQIEKLRIALVEGLGLTSEKDVIEGEIVEEDEVFLDD